VIFASEVVFRFQFGKLVDTLSHMTVLLCLITQIPRAALLQRQAISI